MVDETHAAIEAAVLAGEAEWRQLVETLPQIVWITRPDGWHLHFNRQWMDFTGRTLVESLGHGWNPAFHPDDRQRAATRWDEATSTGEPYEIEYRLRRADGVYRWMLGRAMPLRDERGTIVKWFGTCTDIDDLKRAQAEVEQSRSLHRLAGSMARLAGWSIDLAAGRMIWSEEIHEILDIPPGLDPDPNLSAELVLPEHREPLIDAIVACAETGTPFDLEVELETYAGRSAWARILGEPRRGPDGGIESVAGALQDITALKESAQRSESLARRLTTTLESLTDAFYTLDRDWRFTYVNRRAAAFLRRDRDELLGRVVFEEFAPVRGTELEDAYRSAMTRGETVTLERYHYPPLAAWLEMKVYPSPQGVAVYFRDVTEQHRDQVALRERVKELRALVAVSGAAHTMDDADELCTLAARSLLAGLQHPDHVVAEVMLGDVTCTVGHPPDGAAAPLLHVPVVADQETRGHVLLRGHLPDELAPEEEDLVRAIAETLGLWIGQQRATVELRRVNADLNDANAQLEAAAEVKDDLLSMASHELRTPLTPILGFLEVLEHRGDNLDDAQRQMLHVMRGNARRMLRLVDDLLVVSRATAGVLVPRPQQLRARDPVATVLDELGEGLATLDASLDRCHLVADPQHLQQIVTNLVTNAEKYGAPPVVVRAVDRGHGRVGLEVSDAGEGVPPEFRDRMWERFAQKDRGDTRTATGTGLGLAIVKLLAETNGGTVSYREADPHGSVFSVELPGRIEPERS